MAIIRFNWKDKRQKPQWKCPITGQWGAGIFHLIQLSWGNCSRIIFPNGNGNRNENGQEVCIMFCGQPRIGTFHFIYHQFEFWKQNAKVPESLCLHNQLIKLDGWNRNWKCHRTKIKGCEMWAFSGFPWHDLIIFVRQQAYVLYGICRKKKAIRTEALSGIHRICLSWQFTLIVNQSACINSVYPKSPNVNTNPSISRLLRWIFQCQERHGCHDYVCLSKALPLEAQKCVHPISSMPPPASDVVYPNLPRYLCWKMARVLQVPLEFRQKYPQKDEKKKPTRNLFTLPNT